METLEGLGRKVRTAHDLLAVVKTMKSLAAVNIRQYAAAALAMDAYGGVVANGWQALLWNRPLPRQRERGQGAVCCLILGSDQGMCGQFNELVAQTAWTMMASAEGEGLGGEPIVWTAGERVRAIAEELGKVEAHFPLPLSLAAIGELIMGIVSRFAALHGEGRVGHFWVCANRLGRAGSYAPGVARILPLEHHRPATRQWPGRALPMLGLRAEQLYEHLFRQHLFATLYTAFVQSLASENAARLVAMQAAEQNIRELEEGLQARFRETRQNAITAELLDIVSGFEALGAN
jgi:F-type H+-transporting ATPase subunit gamma